jgi:hypothetical protein
MNETAKKLIKQLDGMTIEEARLELQIAISLLPRTQIVSKDSPLLRGDSSTVATSQGSPSPAIDDPR